jgi:hypothetical protein
VVAQQGGVERRGTAGLRFSTAAHGVVRVEGEE